MGSEGVCPFASSSSGMRLQLLDKGFCRIGLGGQSRYIFAGRNPYFRVFVPLGVNVIGFVHIVVSSGIRLRKISTELQFVLRNGLPSPSRGVSQIASRASVALAPSSLLHL